MDKILIRGLEISACHGVNESEKTEPQPFIFDADIMADLYAAALNDDLNETVNYSSLCRLIATVATENTYNLIEKLAYECLFAVFEGFEAVKAVSLTVRKPEAPMKRKFDSVGVTVSAVRETAYLSLGSSTGDRKNYLDTAVRELAATRGIRVTGVSDYIATNPYGGVAKNEFLNCAVKISTVLSPHALLREIHRIEDMCGRVRELRWDDRTLDIDIVFFGDKTVEDDVLTIPHPDYMNRDFVKIPLQQLGKRLN